MRDVVDLTPELLACIAAVRPDAPGSYRQDRAAVSAAARGLAPPEAESAADVEIPAIAAAEELPRLHEGQREAIDRLVGCALGYVERDYPLLPGERVESDYASYLTAPYLRLPPGTAVVRRSTNMAEIYYLITNVRVDDRGDVHPIATGVPLPRLRGGSGKFSMKGLAATGAEKLVGALAGAIGGAIGSWFVETLFPPGVPDYFDEVYEKTSKIVEQRLDESTIRSINGTISAIGDHLRTEYIPARRVADLNNRKDRKTLFDLLQKYDTAYLSGPGGMLGTLMNERYAQAGFGVFLFGASLQLAIFQEMANVVPQTRPGTDPKANQWLEPLQTSYGLPEKGTVAQNAEAFARFAEQTWPKVLAARLAVIKPTTYDSDKIPVNDGTGDYFWNRYGAIDDGGEKVQPRIIEKKPDKDGKSPLYEQVKRDTEAYREQVRASFTEAYCHPEAIVRAWRQLVKQPIHPVSQLKPTPPGA